MKNFLVKNIKYRKDMINKIFVVNLKMKNNYNDGNEHNIDI